MSCRWSCPIPDQVIIPATSIRDRAGLQPRVSLYAAMLSAAGLPLYIHLPRFASVELGIGLATVGVILLSIRVIDLVQDPLIGWAIDRWPGAQRTLALLAAAGLALGFPVLFTLSEGPRVAWYLTGVLIFLYSAYSLGMILLYGRSTSLAPEAGPDGLLRNAAWREGGLLTGVILAASGPALMVLAGAEGQGYGAFGWLLCALAVTAAMLSGPLWRRPVGIGRSLTFQRLRHSGAMRLLVLATVNGLPVAVTSTLFLFFVEDRLQLGGAAGVLLVLFFAAAAVSIPFWLRVCRALGPKRALLTGMVLAIAAFSGAGLLPPGNLVGFAVICVASGIALGADMVILPVLFSMALARAGLNASLAFGIWSFAGKFGLALAAFLVLPALAMAGFVPGGENPPAAVMALTFGYAVLPCILKSIAVVLTMALRTEDQR